MPLLVLCFPESSLSLPPAAACHPGREVRRDAVGPRAFCSVKDTPAVKKATPVPDPAVGRNCSNPTSSSESSPLLHSSSSTTLTSLSSPPRGASVQLAQLVVRKESIGGPGPTPPPMQQAALSLVLLLLLLLLSVAHWTVAGPNARLRSSPGPSTTL